MTPLQRASAARLAFCSFSLFSWAIVVLLGYRSGRGKAEHDKLGEQRDEANLLHRILPSMTRR
ncbi:MAG TPA: hypothetical protein VEO53_01230, partial [Candidatus Binatia bacterium]|nr:hypothetical protein [Candidatus Binatia bacterium]